MADVNALLTLLMQMQKTTCQSTLRNSKNDWLWMIQKGIQEICAYLYLLHKSETHTEIHTDSTSFTRSKDHLMYRPQT